MSVRSPAMNSSSSSEELSARCTSSSTTTSPAGFATAPRKRATMSKRQKRVPTGSRLSLGGIAAKRSRSTGNTCASSPRREPAAAAAASSPTRSIHRRSAVFHDQNGGVAESFRLRPHQTGTPRASAS